MNTIPRAPDEERIVGMIQRTRSSRVVVSVRQWDARRAADVRLQFRDAAGEWRSTPRGFGLQARAQVDELVAALAAARDALPG